VLTLLIANLTAALAAPLLVARAKRMTPWLLAAVPLVTAAGLLTTWLQGGRVALGQHWDWAPSLGAAFSLRTDGLAMLFIGLIGLIGALVILHAGRYLSGSAHQGRFFLLILVFLAAMFGLVLADNLWFLFVCWEMTSLTSYFLIGYKNDQAYARNAARQALLTTGAGGLALLAGFAVLAAMGQSVGLTGSEAATISSLLVHGDALRADPRYSLALGLILIGAFTKSAQIPLHHWLPRAMAGPTPVSALLHSATMVKAGVFLLARLNPALGGSDLWFLALGGIGTITMLGGALMAIGRTDLKEILAYTTISALGTLVLLIGLGTPSALAAMVVFLTVHALYKASLFLVVANLDLAAGTRELKQLAGWGRVLPLTAVAAFLAALGQAGAPPALGYLGKKLALQAKFGVPAVGDWLVLAAVLTNIAMVALALTLAVRPFWGRTEPPPLPQRKIDFPLTVGPLVLGALGVAVGLVPSVFDNHLGTAAASAAFGSPVHFDLKVWSGLNLESLLLIGISLGVFLAGYLLYRHLHVFQGRPALPTPLQAITPTRLYERGLEGFLAAASQVTGRMQGGRLRVYVGFVALAVAGLVGPALISATGRAALGVDSIQLHEVLLVAIMAAGALGGAFTNRPMVGALSVGMTGFGIALVFALFGGIDVAITLMLVETLVVVILAAFLSRLPRQIRPTSAWSKLRDLAVAGSLGLAVTLVVLLPAGGVRSRELAETLLAWSVPEAAGRNVVNVILVDFRAMDTLGEIVVVAAAALTVIALLAIPRRRSP
jgi:multicomponent Na+:H+ antiporter subunit A